MMSAPAPVNAAPPRFDTYLICDRDRYRFLQAAHADNVVILDANGVVRYASTTAHRSLGYAGRSELLGQSILSLLHRRDMLNTRVMLERLRTGATPALNWVTRLRATGRWEWFKVRAARFDYDGGRETVTAVFLMPLRRS